VFRILFDSWQNAGCDNTMSPAEIMVDLCVRNVIMLVYKICVCCSLSKRSTLQGQGDGLLQLLQLFCQSQGALGCYARARHICKLMRCKPCQTVSDVIDSSEPRRRDEAWFRVLLLVPMNRRATNHLVQYLIHLGEATAATYCLTARMFPL